MKKLYIKPITELVVVNLQDSVLEDLPIGDPSDVGTGMDSNIGSIDLEEDMDDLPTSKSLWD
ncbi:MAG: hypothetical protein J5548_02570 [Prevotella sp.]|jgi:hypothetical protein|nr:hypothetical protein [Prevotella sp.]